MDFLGPGASCAGCGEHIPKSIAKCPKCGRERTHRDCFPEQYQHRLVGRLVRVETGAGFQTRGVVERVFETRFGLLAALDTSGTTAYRVADCTPVHDDTGGQHAQGE